MAFKAEPEVPTLHPIAEIAEARLWASPYNALRNIFCKYHEGVLVLRGRLTSFFQLQLAQEIVAGIKGVERVVNQIEVIDPDESHSGFGDR